MPGPSSSPPPHTSALCRPDLSPLPLLTVSQTTLHFCGRASLASVQQGQMPFHFLAFDRCLALSSVSPSWYTRTTTISPVKLSSLIPFRLRGWDWQEPQSNMYLYRENTLAINQLKLVQHIKLELCLAFRQMTRYYPNRPQCAFRCGIHKSKSLSQEIQYFLL